MSQPSTGHQVRRQGASVLETLQRLKSGALSPRTLDAEGRQAVVAHLIGEGWTTPEMARLLEVSDRTIHRDRNAVQVRNAPRRDQAEVDAVAGRLRLEADASISRIRRAARDPEAAPRDRIEAERAVWDVLHRCIPLLQSLGFLPRAPQHVSAELTHYDGELPSLEELQAEAQALQSLETHGAADPELQEILEELTHASIAQRLALKRRTAESDRQEESG